MTLYIHRTSITIIPFFGGEGVDWFNCDDFVLAYSTLHACWKRADTVAPRYNKVSRYQKKCSLWQVCFHVCYITVILPFFYPASRVSFNLPRKIRKRKETLLTACTFFDPPIIQKHGWVSPVSNWSSGLPLYAHA